jgi:hypothetical protein
MQAVLVFSASQLFSAPWPWSAIGHIIDDPNVTHFAIRL